MNLGKAKEHLQTYLKRDKNGLRKALLSILLDGKPHTIPEIHERLIAMGFSISLRATSALVGFAHSRPCPILTYRYSKDKRFYLINPTSMFSAFRLTLISYSCESETFNLLRTSITSNPHSQSVEDYDCHNAKNSTKPSYNSVYEVSIGY